MYKQKNKIIIISILILIIIVVLINKTTYSLWSNNFFIDKNFYSCVVEGYNKQYKKNYTTDYELSYGELKMIHEVSCSNRDVIDTTGIEKLISLKVLDLSNNDIENIDLRNNLNIYNLKLDDGVDIIYNNKTKIKDIKYEYNVLKESQEENNKYFSTGDIIEINDNEHNVIIYGDVTGDGKAEISDVAKLYQAVRKKTDLEDIDKIAGNIAGNDNKIKINDVAKHYQFLKGKIKVDFKEQYTYKEFIDEIYEVEGCYGDNKVVWNINGYDYSGDRIEENLPIVNGENKVIISCGENKKEFNINITKDEEQLLLDDEYLNISADYLDYDNDGITNIEEVELGLSTYTNDTDDDGLEDNVEILMGLDPLIEDPEEEREYTVKITNNNESEVALATINEEITVEIPAELTVKGVGNIANTYLESTDLPIYVKEGFVRSNVAKISSTNSKKNNKMTIKLKKENKYLEDNKLAIYEYNDDNRTFNMLDSSSDGIYLYADVTNFNSYYFIGMKSNEPVEPVKDQIMILIDNSASMYNYGQIVDILGPDNENIDKDDFLETPANDDKFNRLKLMNDLVERLGTDDYIYSVHSFTHNNCDILDGSTDIEEIKNSINSIKTTCQNFNGTYISGAIREYNSHFNDDIPGERYMIVLTDGTETGFGVIGLMDFEYNQMVKNGIKVITIGLGDEIDSEFLHGIATKTNGKYLYASDSNMLSDLTDILEEHIIKPDVTIDGEDYTLIADSGFKVGRDNFSFENFGSVDSVGGNCYGFSYLSRLIYLNQFELSGEAIDSDMPGADLIAYNLTEKNKNRLKKGNVYNIDLDDIYDLLLEIGSYANRGEITDFWELNEDGIPVVTDKYINMSVSTGFKLRTRESSKELLVNGIKDKYDKYEMLYIDLLDDNITGNNKDDYQVLQLINRFYRYQKHAVGAVIMDNIDHISNKVGPNFYKFDIEQLIDKLNEGDPVLLSIKGSIGNHSVLATKVYKSTNSENYVIGIYDSNAPHNEALATVKRVTNILGISRYTFEFNSAGISFDSMVIDGTLLSLEN